MENESPSRKENFNYRLTDGFGLPWAHCSSNDDESLRESRSIGTRCFSFLSGHANLRHRRGNVTFCDFANVSITIKFYLYDDIMWFNKIIFLLRTIIS